MDFNDFAQTRLLGKTENVGNRSDVPDNINRIELFETKISKGIQKNSNGNLVADAYIHNAATGQNWLHESVEITNAFIGRKNYSFGPVHSNYFQDHGKVYEDKEGLLGPIKKYYRLTPKQDHEVLQFIRSRSNEYNRSDYAVLRHNCRTFTISVDSYIQKLLGQSER